MNPFGEYAALRRFTRNLHQSRFWVSSFSEVGHSNFKDLGGPVIQLELRPCSN